MQLEGTFRQFPLRELIEMAVYSSVSGILEVQIGPSTGRIYFRDGLPQHAEADGLIGIDAIGRMFAEQHAAFRFVADSEPVQPTLWMDPWELIDLAEHQAQTWVQIRAFIPSLTVIPSLRGPVDTQQVSIGEEGWTVLPAIDGHRSILEIARYLTISVIDVCTSVTWLARNGLVTLRGAPPASDSSSPDDNANAPRSGFFERLIERTMEEERRRTEPRISEPRQSEPQFSEPRQSEPRSSQPRVSAPQPSEPRFTSDPGKHRRDP